MVVTKLLPVDCANCTWPRVFNQARSWRPSALKSPTVKVTNTPLGFQVAHKALVVKDEPVETLTHHWWTAAFSPMMSDLPSPVTSATMRLLQVTELLHNVHRLDVKALEALDRPTHHPAVCWTRPATSATPSPLKSPTCSSTQVTVVAQLAQSPSITKLEPVDRPTLHVA